MIVAAIGQKGGVGKTTLMINLACEMMRRGNAVLLVDADDQATVRTWGEVADEEGHEAPAIIAMGATMHKDSELPRIAQAYDWTFIDTKGAYSKIQKSALMTCDVALMPVGSSPLDLWGVAQTIDVVEEAQITRPQLDARFVFSKWKGRTVISRRVKEAVDGSGFEALDPAVPDLVAYCDCMVTGQGVTIYDSNSKAARVIRKLADRLEAIHHACHTPAAKQA